MPVAAEESITISKSKIKNIFDDPKKTAEAVNLVYVSNMAQGINRLRKGKIFSYLCGEEIITDEKILQRIKSLVIPPAWDEVWVCKLSNGHLQATGLDTKKRKQYKYHSLWNALRNQTKFYRLQDFGKSLPAIRLQLENDIAVKGLPQ